jgi:integrase
LALQSAEGQRTGSTEKNNSGTIVPIGPDLLEALRTFPSGAQVYLETQYGKPFTPTGFYNWFKRACVKAGIAHCSRPAQGHEPPSGRGWRHRSGGRAVTGHKTDREFAKYAESASKRALAGRGNGERA